MRVSITFLLFVDLLLLPCAWAKLRPSSRNEYCLYSIYQSLSELSWVGSGSETAFCNATNQVTSVYASSKIYCTDDELSAGLGLWGDYCDSLSSPLLDLSGISANATPAYIAALPRVDPYQNSSATLESPSVLTKYYYDIALHTYLVTLDSLPRNTRISWSVMGYWGFVLVLGMFHRLWTYIWSLSAGASTNGDTEHGRQRKRSPRQKGVLGSVRHYFNTYLVVPAAVASYRQRRLFGCSIPNRLEVLVVVGYWLLCIILNFGFYDIFTPNVRWPTASYQAWKYVAQRTSMFAYASLPWLFLFAGRNNIFIWLTGWSYNTFNVFHRHLSRLTTIFGIVHAIAYTVLYTVYTAKYKEELASMWFKFGIVATIMMGFQCGLSFPFIRTKCYELFLVGHIIFAVILVVSLFIHTSRSGTEYAPYLWPVVALWCFDRFMRLVRLAYCNLHVSLSGHIKSTTALVTYNRDADVIRLDVDPGSTLNASAGQYFHIYQLTTWRGWENHPFTFAGYASTPSETVSRLPSNLKEAANTSEPFPNTLSEDSLPSTPALVFWIRPYDSWTKRLRDQCLKSSSSIITSNNSYQLQLPLSLEGPYGHSFLLRNFDSIVMIVGGTGIATALPYIQEHISGSASASGSSHSTRASRVTKITLVWAVRSHAFIKKVCGSDLAPAIARDDFEGRFFCTGSGSQTNTVAEKDGAEQEQETVVRFFRPDIEDIIFRTASEAQDADATLAVLSCGPAVLVDAVRKSTADALRRGNRNIRYFEEAYE